MLARCEQVLDDFNPDVTFSFHAFAALVVTSVTLVALFFPKLLALRSAAAASVSPDLANREVDVRGSIKGDDPAVRAAFPFCVTLNAPRSLQSLHALLYQIMRLDVENDILARKVTKRATDLGLPVPACAQSVGSSDDTNTYGIGLTPVFRVRSKQPSSDMQPKSGAFARSPKATSPAGGSRRVSEMNNFPPRATDAAAHAADLKSPAAALNEQASAAVPLAPASAYIVTSASPDLLNA